METISTGRGLAYLTRLVKAGNDHHAAMKRLRRAVNACRRACRNGRDVSATQITEQREAAELAFWTLHRLAEASYQTAEHMKDWWYVYSHRL